MAWRISVSVSPRLERLTQCKAVNLPVGNAAGSTITRHDVQLARGLVPRPVPPAGVGAHAAAEFVGEAVLAVSDLRGQRVVSSGVHGVLRFVFSFNAANSARLRCSATSDEPTNLLRRGP